MTSREKAQLQIAFRSFLLTCVKIIFGMIFIPIIYLITVLIFAL